MDCRQASTGTCERFWASPRLRLLLAIGALLFFGGAVLGGCGDPEPIQVVLQTDGKQQALRITAAQLTVGELLTLVGVALGPLDRVEPDLYVQLSPGIRVVVTRVQETFETERQTLPFAHQTVRNEGVPEGEHRLLQTGRNGEIEITYRVLFEDGVEISRQEVRRQILAQPVDELVLVGGQEEMGSVPISGTIVYLSGGNAWLMRETRQPSALYSGDGQQRKRSSEFFVDGPALFGRGSPPGSGY
jgi:hypothetical protein